MIERESLVHRKSELEKKLKTEQEALQSIMAEEKNALDTFARGASRRDVLDGIKSHRAYLEESISTTKLLISSIEGQLAAMPDDDFETVAAAKEALARSKYDELRNDILTTCLPKMKLAFIYFNLSGRSCQPAYFPAFFFENLIQNPSKEEWCAIEKELDKTKEGQE